MGQKKPRLTAEEQIRRAEEALERRIRQRMDREREAGTVFFTAPIETGFQELKLQGDRLTFLRPRAGSTPRTGAGCCAGWSRRGGRRGGCASSANCGG